MVEKSRTKTYLRTGLAATLAAVALNVSSVTDARAAGGVHNVAHNTINIPAHQPGHVQNIAHNTINIPQQGRVNCNVAHNRVNIPVERRPVERYNVNRGGRIDGAVFIGADLCGGGDIAVGFGGRNWGVGINVPIGVERTCGGYGYIRPAYGGFMGPGLYQWVAYGVGPIYCSNIEDFSADNVAIASGQIGPQEYAVVQQPVVASTVVGAPAYQVQEQAPEAQVQPAPAAPANQMQGSQPQSTTSFPKVTGAWTVDRIGFHSDYYYYWPAFGEKETDARRFNSRKEFDAENARVRSGHAQKAKSGEMVILEYNREQIVDVTPASSGGWSQFKWFVAGAAVLGAALWGQKKYKKSKERNAMLDELLRREAEGGRSVPPRTAPGT